MLSTSAPANGAASASRLENRSDDSGADAQLAKRFVTRIVTSCATTDWRRCAGDGLCVKRTAGHASATDAYERAARGRKQVRWFSASGGRSGAC